MDELHAILDEANFDPWESVTHALAGAQGLVPPRVAWLLQHLNQTKREHWQVIVDAAGVPSPPTELDLTELMKWESQAVRALTPEQRNLRVVYEGREFSIASLLRLNARHTVWHAGQIAALTQTRTA